MIAVVVGRRVLPSKTNIGVLAVATLALVHCDPTPRPWDAAADVVVDAAREASAVDVAVARDVWTTGCPDPSTDDALARVMPLVTTYTQTPPPTFQACLTHLVTSPLAMSFAEELSHRLRSARLAPLRCATKPVRDDSLAAAVQGMARGEVVEVTVHPEALGRFPVAQLAAMVLQRVVEAVGYPAPEPGEEAAYGLPAQVARCMGEALGDASLAGQAVMTRDQMHSEAALQPFGVPETTRLDVEVLRCPPGAWVVGAGVSLGSTGGAQPVDYVAAFQVQCRPSAGGETTRVGVETTASARCADDAVAVGMVAQADAEGVYAMQPRCVPWSQIADGDAQGEVLPLPGMLRGHRIERRCPAGQALWSVELGRQFMPRRGGTVDLHCRRVDLGPVPEFVPLDGIGVVSIIPPDGRRFRCGDQGVITGFFGHRHAVEMHPVRLGAFCQSTEHGAGGLQFRRAGDRLLEHVIPATGGDARLEIPPAVPFDAGTARCPAGTAVVGLRARRGGRYGAPHHLMALCAPLASWTGSVPPTPTEQGVTGVWPGPSAEPVETALCPTGHFLVGYTVGRYRISTGSAVVGHLRGLCRDLREHPER